jgi:hypothetical protein
MSVRRMGDGFVGELAPSKMKEETTNSLYAGAIGAASTSESSVPRTEKKENGKMCIACS